MRLVFDSDLHGTRRMPCSQPLAGDKAKIPAMKTRAFDLETLDGSGRWRPALWEENNHQRLAKVPLEAETAGLRLIPRASWGGAMAHLFAFDAR